MFNLLSRLIRMAFCLIAFTAVAPILTNAQVMDSHSKGDVESFAPTTKTSQPFAFIELFTSEGCSSCPSADRNLARIAKQAVDQGKNVYTLSYHVDYWNRLGWKDPYSSAEFSNRQREYARNFDSTRIYTPQMIVNGQAEFVGSNRKSSNRAVEIALNIDPTATIRLQANQDGQNVNVNWQAKGLRDGDVVRVALVQNSGEQQVTRGENTGRKLAHVNIVRKLKSDSQPGRSGRISFVTPAEFDKNNFHVVAFVQSKRGVTAAAKSPVSGA